MEGQKHTLFKTNLWTRFTRSSIAEFDYSTDPGSVEKKQTFEKSKLEPATRDNLDWSKFGYWEHLILYNKQRLESTSHGSQRDKAETNQSRLGKRVLQELNIKKNPKQHVVS
jgi:hypothetical protein